MIEGSEWLQQLQNLMQLSGAVIDLMDLQGSSVAVYLEDGCDTTATVCLVTTITFFPTIINQLLDLLTCNISDDVGQCIIKLLVHIINLVNEVGRKEILLTYIKVRILLFNY